MLTKLALSFASLLVASAALAPLVAADQLSGSLKQFEYNAVKAKQEQSDNKVFYLSPGMSYCGTKYRGAFILRAAYGMALILFDSLQTSRK